jgi:non-ribosomal peptide synthetase component E (peptide arylation enzyme)
LLSPQKAQLCNPCPRNELSPISQEGQDGYLRFMGRKKEIIVRGGSNISPRRWRPSSIRHRDVCETGVNGVPGPTWGERAVAFVSPSPGASVTPSKLIAFVGKRVGEYKNSRGNCVSRKPAEECGGQGAAARDARKVLLSQE